MNAEFFIELPKEASAAYVVRENGLVPLCKRKTHRETKLFTYYQPAPEVVEMIILSLHASKKYLYNDLFSIPFDPTKIGEYNTIVINLSPGVFHFVVIDIPQSWCKLMNWPEEITLSPMKLDKTKLHGYTGLDHQLKEHGFEPGCDHFIVRLPMKSDLASSLSPEECEMFLTREFKVHCYGNMDKVEFDRKSGKFTPLSHAYREIEEK